MTPRLLSFMAAYGAYVLFINTVDGPWRRWEKGNVFDTWTITHVAWGVLAKRWGLSLKEIATLTALNELGEASYPTFGGESPANAAADVLTTLAAYVVTPRKK